MTTQNTDYKKITKEFRTEVYNNFCYVRNLSEKGGVITALLETQKANKKVREVLESTRNETFSQVWDKLIGIKGARFNYQSN